MSGGKKRSGFQITSVTSDFNQTPAGQSAPSVVLTVLQSAASSCSPQGSSSQPTTPSLKRKYISHDASGQGAGSSSRFRVVRLAVGGAGSSGRGEPYRRGRWTCMDFMEQQEGAGFRRVMDTMRHAHSLESLEMIGRDIDRGRVHSQDTAHLLAQPIRGREGVGLVLRSGLPSPTHQEPINIRLLEPMGVQCFDPTPSLPSPRPRNVPPPLRLDVDATGRSVLRLSHSQPSSPPAGSYHPTLTPVPSTAAFNLDQTMFHLPGDARTIWKRKVCNNKRRTEDGEHITNRPVPTWVHVVACTVVHMVVLCPSDLVCQDQFGVKGFAQRYLHMCTGGAGDRTTDPLINDLLRLITDSVVPVTV